MGSSMNERSVDTLSHCLCELDISHDSAHRVVVIDLSCMQACMWLIINASLLTMIDATNT